MKFQNDSYNPQNMHITYDKLEIQINIRNKKENEIKRKKKRKKEKRGKSGNDVTELEFRFPWMKQAGGRTTEGS